MDASHRRSWIVILDLYLFGIDYFYLSCLFVENGGDLDWSLGGLLLISEDNGGLDGVAVGDGLGRDGLCINELWFFLLDGLDNCGCLFSCRDLLIAIGDDLDLAVRIGVGAGLDFYFWLLGAFLHVVDSDVFGLEIFGDCDLLLGVVFSLDDKFVSLNVRIGSDCA